MQHFKPTASQDFFVLNGYCTQEDISTVFIGHHRYKTLKVYTKDETVHTFYFPVEESHILQEIISAEPTMRRNGRTIGINKVKGLCTVIGYEIDQSTVVVNQVSFLPRNIPRSISNIMKENRLQVGPIHRVSKVDNRRNQVIDLEIPSENEEQWEEEEEDCY